MIRMNEYDFIRYLELKGLIEIKESRLRTKKGIEIEKIEFLRVYDYL
jgi:hypothetical protein